MRKILTILLFLCCCISIGSAQWFKDPFRFPEENTLLGGVGITTIGDTSYTTFTIAPEFSFGKVGVGLNLQFLMNNDNDFKLRKDEYEGGAGVFRAIRYIRIGQKYEDYFFRFGALDRATLGNGFLVWNYNNSTNYDKRRLGLAADVDFGQFGFESVVGSMTSSTIQGYTAYVRPFRFIGVDNYLLKHLRFHTTYARDNSAPDGDTKTSVSAFGFGADIRIIDLPLLKSHLYADYGKFEDLGDGQAVGINLIFPEFYGLFGLAATFERRFINEQFIPNYFGPLYELERQIGALDSLRNAPETAGYFGQLVGHVTDRVRLIGNYTYLTDVPGGGAVHLEASAPKLVPGFELRAYYDKIRIETLDDLRTLDARSVATAEIGYQLNSFLLLTTSYRWYWVETEPNVFKPQERIEPRLSFRYRF